mgnify:CR=1 FL=1
MVGVKNNQKQLFQHIQSIFAENKEPADRFYSEDKGHGREEQRTVEILPVDDNMKFPHARTVVRIHRIRVPICKGKRGSPKPETAYYLTSLSRDKDNLTAEKAGALVRGHWSAIENGLHHIKDASLLEDRYRANNGLGRIIAAMRSLAVLLFRPLKYTTLNAMTKVSNNLHHAIHFLRYSSLDKARKEFLQ